MNKKSAIFLIVESFLEVFQDKDNIYISNSSRENHNDFINWKACKFVLNVDFIHLFHCKNWSKYQGQLRYSRNVLRESTNYQLCTVKMFLYASIKDHLHPKN